jgi:hypothetical protein
MALIGLTPLLIKFGVRNHNTLCQLKGGAKLHTIRWITPVVAFKRYHQSGGLTFF